jgi:hypothetical protein
VRRIALSEAIWLASAKPAMNLNLAEQMGGSSELIEAQALDPQPCSGGSETA